jgi:hypothetical protein
MNKKEFFIPFIFIGLAAAFLFISAMVYFSNGKKKWVGRKMKIGSLLLTLSLFSCGNDNYREKPYSTCYIVAITVPFYSNNIETEIDTNNIIYGSLNGRQNEDFSYTIVDTKGIVKQKNDIFTETYMSDPYSQEFMVEVNKNLNTGNYQFNLYNCKLKEQDPKFLIHKYQFIIKQE